MREVGGRTVLMDFSGAQPLLSGSGEQVMSGTPVYMAPELFDGSPASTASDVYSLGVLLFFLVSGTVPVEGATLEEVRQAHGRRERKDLRDLRPDLAEPLIAVIERATAHDPALRYRTVSELDRGLGAASGSHVAVSEAAGAQIPGGLASVGSGRVKAMDMEAAVWTPKQVFSLPSTTPPALPEGA
jgi:serine/threonine protein kinase